MIAFYLDENVHGSVARELERRGIDVLTVVQDGMSGSADYVVLNRAGVLRRLLYTNDEDLLVEARHRQSVGEEFAGVVYCHQFTQLGPCVASREMIAKCGDLEEYANRVQYIPL